MTPLAELRIPAVKLGRRLVYDYWLGCLAQRYKHARRGRKGEIPMAQAAESTEAESRYWWIASNPPKRQRNTPKLSV